MSTPLTPLSYACMVMAFFQLLCFAANFDVESKGGSNHCYEQKRPRFEFATSFAHTPAASSMEEEEEEGVLTKERKEAKSGLQL